MKKLNQSNATKQQLIALFLAQPFGTLVGPEKRFKTLEHLCRYACEYWGYEGVTIPAGGAFADIGRILREKQYRDDLIGMYKSWGTPAFRFEIHTEGQQLLIHPAELERYRGFAPAGSIPTGQENNHRAYEEAAEKRQLDIIRASHLLGWENVVDFSGNRAWTTLKYPWSAYSLKLRLKILLLVYLKHRKVLKLCAKLGIKKAFELHPEEDLHSPWLLYLFREIARKLDGDAVANAIVANADASHETMVGGSAADQFEFMLIHKLIDEVLHLKDAQVMIRQESEREKPWVKGGSLMGDFAPKWSKSARRFVTVGCGDADWDRIKPVIKTAHKRSKNGLPLVCELECSLYTDMMQGAEIAAENARRIRGDRPLLSKRNKMRIPRASTLGNWEDFCTGDAKVEMLLAMDESEQRAVRQMEGQLIDIDASFVEEHF